MGCLLWITQIFLVLMFFHLRFQHAGSLALPTNLSSSAQLCPHDQNIALLQFKNSFSISSAADTFYYVGSDSPFLSYCQPEYPKTESWKVGTDCCSWDGVTCDMKTGHVIGLDLSCSMLHGTLHSNSTLFFLSHLQKLDLSNNNFSSSHISSQFGNLLHLTHLSMRSSFFAGQLPSEISQLTRLVSLSLSMNYDLTLEPNSFKKLVQNLTQLRVLKLNWANMSLVLPSSLMNLSSSLSHLSLSHCGLRGKFPDKIFGRLNLQALSLWGNEGLTGSLPSSNVSGVLHFLDLSRTKISILFDKEFVRNLKSLQSLYLRSCKNIASSNLPLLGNLTQLEELDLSFNNLSAQIPTSLGNLVHLNHLDLQFNNFTGEIPDTFANLTQLASLHLSNNQLKGAIPSQTPYFLFALPSLEDLALDNNLFTGHIGQFKHNSLRYINLRNNKLTGEIPTSICKLKFLQILDLSNNSLSGFIPQCLGNFSNSLSVLHLGTNNLQGTIPTIFPKGNNLKYLNLNGNELKGGVPSSIINCAKLEFLDVGNNKIEDTFPNFLATLSDLQVLVLRSNGFHGFVKSPNANHSFPKLQIFDLSDNNFSGTLPAEYFDSFEAMMTLDHDAGYMVLDNFSFYAYSVIMAWKGSNTEFTEIQSILAVIDLSSNNFSGEIPESIAKLKSLEQLNLSHNSFTGYVQPPMGTLTNLESLDLSSNFLTGKIPMQLADLIFLQVLNLSYNHFEGPIPEGKQFNTFDRGSYEGNLRLCGFPLPKKCNGDEGQQQQPSSNFQKENDSIFSEGFGWKAVTIGYGCGLVFGLAIGYAVFRTGKPAWFVRTVEGERRQKARRIRKNGHRNSTRRN